jgi:hypothetical protein
MLPYIAYMDPMGYALVIDANKKHRHWFCGWVDTVWNEGLDMSGQNFTLPGERQFWAMAMHCAFVSSGDKEKVWRHLTVEIQDLVVS